MENSAIKNDEVLNLEYPAKKLRVEKTIYPQGSPTVSPNTGQEFYGVIEQGKNVPRETICRN